MPRLRHDEVRSLARACRELQLAGAIVVASQLRDKAIVGAHLMAAQEAMAAIYNRAEPSLPEYNELLCRVGRLQPIETGEATVQQLSGSNVAPGEPEA